MKVLSVVGARPQFVKLAPVGRRLTAVGAEHVIVHTGQHYDPRMSEAFFRDLRIAAPDVHLEVGSGGHGAQTGAMLAAIDPVLERERPDWVLVYGDTNSTLAGALSAAKLHLPVAHLEAGLRSHNRRMPEEVNRVLTDHAADLCLAPTQLAVDNLQREGLGHRARLVGDVMTDVCLAQRDEVMAQDRRVHGLPDGPFVLATLHRAENTDDPDRLRTLVKALAGATMPVVLAVHPRLRDRAAAAGISLEAGRLVPVEPLGYPDMVAAVLRAAHVVTDSGGLQKEAFLLGTPTITLRAETEWPETLEGGWNVLAPAAEGLHDLLARETGAAAIEPYGDGAAAEAVVATLADERA